MQQSYEEIKKAYPDEWLILGNPVIADNGLDIIAAELLYHGRDKHELALRDKPLMRQYRQRAIVYNCVSPQVQPSVTININLPGMRRPVANSTHHQPLKSKYDEVQV